MTRKKTTKGQPNRRINQFLGMILLACSFAAVVAFAINIYNIAGGESSASSAPVETMTADTGKSMKNDQYTIGNNPTDLEKECFQALTDALNAGDEAAVAEAVARCFVSDYFTWTNKDGNYEVGGLQYIYAGKVAVFEQWSRYNFYSDLDLYISQKGRKKLIEVSSITTDQPTVKAPDFVTYDFIDNETRKELSFDTYEVNLSWTYTSNGADTSSFPSGARFFVVKDEGRWEIAEFYDYESIREWEDSQQEE